MDTNKDTQIESAEELEAEKEHLAEVGVDELRAEVVSTYGFDEETDKERIDKAVEREMGYKKSLSGAIGQKIKYRTEYSKLKATPPKTDTTPKGISPEEVSRIVSEQLEKSQLDSMDYPDEIKQVISSVAKINNTSHRKAVEDPYVKAKIDAWRKTQDAKETALTRNNRTGKTGGDDSLTPPDFDVSTKEGREEYDKWKQSMIKKGF